LAATVKFLVLKHDSQCVEHLVSCGMTLLHSILVLQNIDWILLLESASRHLVMCFGHCYYC